MTRPFHFLTRLNLVELLGLRAQNVGNLLGGLKQVPGSSIYYHTHRFIQQHHYLSPEPPNDLAFWVTNSLGMDALGEKLASIDTVKFQRIQDLRERFISILESFLRENNRSGDNCQEGEEFHFMSCRTFILPTPYQARDLGEFLEILRKIGINSIYYHIFEAKLHLEKGENDFSNWFEEIGEKELALDLNRLDPYTVTLEGLRNTIMRQVSRYVQNQ
jgi:hypothetical protein